MDSSSFLGHLYIFVAFFLVIIEYGVGIESESMFLIKINF
jgi:hypothetical protein